MKTGMKFYLLIVLLLVPAQFISAQSEKSKVLLEVSTNQKTAVDVKTRFTNFIKGSLINLKEVELVKENEDYKINIMMFPNLTKEGENLGYVISAIFLSPSSCTGYNGYEYMTSLLSTSAESELDSTAKNIVSSFNENILNAPK